MQGSMTKDDVKQRGRESFPRRCLPRSEMKHQRQRPFLRAHITERTPS